MIKKKRFFILVVDKKKVYTDKFKGLRKNLFNVESVETVFQKTTSELDEINSFFIVLYNHSDVIQLLQLSNNSNIVVGTSNLKILKTLKMLNIFNVIDLNSKFDIFKYISFQKDGI
jgi:hypothetical protein